ncbi:PX domain-containing kinase isoform X2 [Brachionus plicatilis]|uniref:PX domain-containing kinase isoform X2 n=1 Tax=Brachionus plicatilis TaxID=10195 RepID=A0A3M7RNR1_BRAPC|nr:PX domain-containing kinase isoform X2 [Brachionus plicatilis]
MALNQTNKLDIDDTQPLSCTFLTTETNKDHVVYLIKVQRGIDSKYSWQIKKRYNDFKELNAYLTISNFELQLPPAKIFGNKDKDFLMTRQNGLQNYMDKILGNLFLSMSLPVKKFLDQENYAENFKELALAHVSMFFRSDSNWQVIEPLNEIGWRFRKQHILLKNTEYANNKFILTWIEHGPDKILKEAELKTIFQQMNQIQHEYIDPIIKINTGDLSTIVIQRFNERFISLRDYINGITKINAPFLKKYALHPHYQKIPISLIKQISKKILVTLKFIYSKGLFYGHLHSGNVLIEQNGNTIKLTDLPNAVLGLPCLYRSFVAEQRKITSIEQVDVYGLGHILYEMSYGAPLITSSSRRDFEDCENKELKALLELLLSDDMLAKKSLPAIDELLEIPFFKDTNIEVLPTSSLTAAASTSSASNSNTKLFASSKVKESLVKAKEFIEKKLIDEQKIIYKSKRQSQAEAKVLSEQEIRKRRKEKKKAEKESANSLEFPSRMFLSF